MAADTKLRGERERPSPDIHDFILDSKLQSYLQNSEPQTRTLVETSFRVAQIPTTIGSQITNPHTPHTHSQFLAKLKLPGT